MKQREPDKVETLRMLMSDVKNVEIDKKGELSDDDLVAVVNKSIKKLQEAAVLFEKGGRNDLVGQNKMQIDILSAYLPPQLSDDELKHAIEKLRIENAEICEKNPKAIIGIAMKACSSRADPQRIMQALNMQILPK